VRILTVAVAPLPSPLDCCMCFVLLIFILPKQEIGFDFLHIFGFDVEIIKFANKFLHKTVLFNESTYSVVKSASVDIVQSVFFVVVVLTENCMGDNSDSSQAKFNSVTNKRNQYKKMQ
jgi:hypothetical protein